MANPEWRRQARRLLRKHPFVVYYHEEYRSVSSTPRYAKPADPRGPERLARYLVYEGFVAQNQLRVARRAPFADLLRVHPEKFVESLLPPDPRSAEMPEQSHALRAADVMLRTLRITAGATLAAARAALTEERPAVNLSGGFAGTPARGATGLPAINDVAVAIAALRSSGYLGRIAVVVCSAVDVGAIEDCLMTAGVSASVVSLSTRAVSRAGAASERPLRESELHETWEKALGDIPSEVELVFVMGAVNEAPAGATRSEFEAWLATSRQRDALLVDRCYGVRSVWLPGGRYEKGAWRAFAVTLHALAGEREAHVPADHPSWRLRFRSMAESISPEVLSGSIEPSWLDVASDLGVHRYGSPRFLGYYSVDGIEFALQRYGVLAELQRLGYQDFRVEVSHDSQGDRARLFSTAGGVSHRLAECVAEIATVADRPTVYIHWLILQDPLASLGFGEPGLPGQDAPGLGIAEEISQMFAEVARRLALDGVALVPAWYHTAYMVRGMMRFLSPKRQRRFEVLLELLAGLPLAEASQRVHSGRVSLENQPYQWEADLMAGWLDGSWPECGEESADGYAPRFALP